MTDERESAEEAQETEEAVEAVPSAKDRFTDDELRELLTSVLMLIRAAGDPTGEERARIAVDVHSTVEAVIRRRNKIEEGAWRLSREPGWHKDVGYELQTVLGAHQYEYRAVPKADDPGWHACSCGNWEGYWSDFHPHVTDQLRAVAVHTRSDGQAMTDTPPDQRTRPRAVEAIGRMILDGPGEWIGSGEQLHELASHIAARVGSDGPTAGPGEDWQPWVEIGGVRMTQDQFDAARHPLLHPDATLAPAGPGADRTEPHPVTGVSIPIKPDGSTDWARFAAELRDSATPENGTAEPASGDDALDALCRISHEAYERAAASADWETNPASRVAWAEAAAEKAQLIGVNQSLHADLLRTEHQLAEAVAEERQRIRAELHELAQLLPVEEAQRTSTWLARAFGTSQVAAGSGPVAVPKPAKPAKPICEHGRTGAHPVDPTATQMFWREYPLSCPGPVATPRTYCANGLHSIPEGSDCPSCALVATPAEPDDEHDAEHKRYGTWPCAWRNRNQDDCPIWGDVQGAGTPAEAVSDHATIRTPTEHETMLTAAMTEAVSGGSGHVGRQVAAGWRLERSGRGAWQLVSPSGAHAGWIYESSRREFQGLTAEAARQRAAIEQTIRALDRIVAEPPRSERLRVISGVLAAALGDGD